MLTGLHHVPVACPAGSEDACAPSTADPDLPRHRRLHVDDPVGNRLELLAPVDAG